jgi:hypothetical protein
MTTTGYTLRLNDTEYQQLRYMADKGYDCGILAALWVNHVHDLDGEDVTYRIPEHAIWPCYEAYNEALETGDCPWGPFCYAPLLMKLDALMQEVV